MGWPVRVRHGLQQQVDHLAAHPLGRLVHRGQRRMGRDAPAGRRRSRPPRRPRAPRCRPHAAPAARPRPSGRWRRRRRRGPGTRISSSRIAASPLSWLKSPWRHQPLVELTPRRDEAGEVARRGGCGRRPCPAGPAMVAMWRRPRSTRWSTASRAPSGCRRRRTPPGSVPLARPPSTTGRPRARMPLGQRVVVVQGEQQHAVDVLAGQVVGRGGLCACAGLREQQHQLAVGVAQGRTDPADHTGEERLTEDPLLGLGDHQRDRVGAPGDQGAGRRVGHVAELGDGRLDGLAGSWPRPSPRR